jgi:hypothetical protein
MRLSRLLPPNYPLFWLLFIIAGVAGIVLLRSVFDTYGQLHNDSYFYLRMAHSLLDAGPPLLIHGSYETTWPPALPAMIAGLSALSGGAMGVFWASKAVNILLLACAALLLWWRFREDAPAYFALFALAPPLMLLSQTLSEAPFMLAMLFFVMLLERSLQHKWAVLLFAAGLFPMLLFMIRYIGLYGLGITLPAALLLGVMGFRREAVWLSLGSLLSMMLMAGWFYMSHQLTGLATGIERTPAPHSLIEGMYHIIRALGDELNLLHVLGNQQPLLFGITLLIQIGLLGLLWRAWRRRKTSASAPVSLFTMLCVASAGVYFIGISLVHIIFGVHSFYYRLVTPASILLLTGGLHLLLGIQDDGFRARLQQIVTVSAVVCLSLYGPGYALYQQYAEQNLSRGEYETLIENYYEAVPPNSVVVFGHRALYYLRPDVITELPHFEPAFAVQESWEMFGIRLSTQYEGYEFYILQIPPEAIASRDMHPSVVEYLRKNYSGTTELKRLEL